MAFDDQTAGNSHGAGRALTQSSCNTAKPISKSQRPAASKRSSMWWMLRRPLKLANGRQRASDEACGRALRRTGRTVKFRLTSTNRGLRGLDALELAHI